MDFLFISENGGAKNKLQYNELEYNKIEKKNNNLNWFVEQGTHNGIGILANTLPNIELVNNQTHKMTLIENWPVVIE
jgi:hypothetical protein